MGICTSLLILSDGAEEEGVDFAAAGVDLAEAEFLTVDFDDGEAVGVERDLGKGLPVVRAFV